MKIEQIS